MNNNSQGTHMSQAPRAETSSSSQATVLSRGGSDKRLVFSSLAWTKLNFMLHAGQTEVGGFGITRPSDPLYVEDFQIVKQYANSAFVRFDDEAVADLIQDFACHPDETKRRQPENVSRIWIHTHPGSSPHPSGTDEQTLNRVFGGYAWAVMFIIARGGQTYCRLRFNQGPSVDLAIPVYIDHDSLPKMLMDDAQSVADQIVSWPTLYRTCVNIENAGGDHVSRTNDWRGTHLESKTLPYDYFETHGNRSRFSQGAANPGLTPPRNFLPDGTLESLGESLDLDLPTLYAQNAYVEAQLAQDPRLRIGETVPEIGGAETSLDLESSSTASEAPSGSEPTETGST